MLPANHHILFTKPFRTDKKNIMMSSVKHYDAFRKALWWFSKDIIMLYWRHYNEFFSSSYKCKKSLPNDIKKSSQWFGKDIAMIFQRLRDVLPKTSQWFFFEKTPTLSASHNSRLKADWKVILSVIPIYTQSVTSRLKAERRDKKDTCIEGVMPEWRNPEILYYALFPTNQFLSLTFYYVICYYIMGID
jgi:hypothetical protein